MVDIFRGVPEVWDLEPEGNGKTTKLAAFVLYHSQFQEGASVPVAAATRDQAMILYRQAAGFIRRSSLEGWKCYDGYRRIVNKVTGGMIQIFAADAGHGDGVIPTLAVIDEPHRQDNMDLYLTWSGKLGKRAGQLLVISTAGEPGTEFEETRARIKASATRSKQTGAHLRCEAPGIVLHEWALEPGADIDDMRAVKRANPHKLITLAYLKEKRARPTMTEAHWRRFTCNMATRTTTPAVTEKEWREAVDPDGWPLNVECVAGLDVGWRYDSTALVPLVQASEQRLLGPATILVPPVDGQLELGDVTNAIRELHERNPIRLLVMDISDARDVFDYCTSELGLDVVARPVGLKAQVADYREFMEALRAGALRHVGDPGLTRHVLNATVRLLPLGDAVFARPGQGRMTHVGLRDRRMIDALMAAAYANTVVGANPASVYDDRGLIAV